MIANRLPPQNIEAEKELLGTCLVCGDILPEVTDIVSPSSFYRPAHQTIFGAMVDLAGEKQPVDFITVTTRLRETMKLDEVGGAAYLSNLADGVPSRAKATYYAGAVRNKADLRSMITGATALIDRCFSDPYGGNDAMVMEEIEDMVKRLFKANPSRIKGIRHISEFMPTVWARIEAAANGGAMGIPSGFTDLDKMLSGFEPSDLIILAARPSMGKTALCMNMAQHQAINLSIPVGVISLEMSGDQLGSRLLCSVAGVNSHRARAGKLLDTDWPKMTQAAGVINTAPIVIDDIPAQKASIIRRKAIKMKESHGIEILYLDYIQIAKGDTQGQSREREIGEISGELKAIAKELNIPVVALSQLSRQCDSRPDKRPVLSDLRDSGAIEQDADVVLFIYRDEMYNKAKDNPKRGIAEISIAKQRKGPTGLVNLAWQEETTTFKNLITMHERA